MKRKFLSGLLALSMVLTLLPGTALAAETALTIAPATNDASGITQDATDQTWKVEEIAADATLTGSENILTLTVTTENGVVLSSNAKPDVTATSGTIAADKITAGVFATKEQANEAEVTIDIQGLAAGAYTIKADVEVPAVEADADAGTEAAEAYTATGTFAFTITEAEAATYTVSGTVSAGDTGAEVKGIDVTLYKSTDGTRGEAVGTAVQTGEGGVFSFSDVAEGTYVAVVAAATGSYQESVSEEFEVNADKTDVTITLLAGDAAKKTLTAGSFTVTGNTLTYGDALDGVKVAITDDAETAVTVTYQQSGSDVTPKNAGEYDIMAAVAASDKYEEFTATKVGTLTINKAELTLAPKAVTLNNSDAVPEVSALEYEVTGLKNNEQATDIMGAVTMAYYDEAGTTTATPVTGTEGTFTIKVESAALKDADGNYTLSTTYGTATLKILAAGETAPTGITVSPTTLALKMGETESGTLTATVTPTGATGEVTFTSSAPTVATVEKNADGTATVTAVAEGDATITAKIGGFEAECAVTVAAAAAAEKVTLTFAPDGGELAADAEKITITASDAEAAIHYTVDGTDPTATAGGAVKAYDKTSGIAVADLFADAATSVTIKAVAVKDGALAGDIVTKAFTKAAAIANKAEIATVTISGEAEKALEGDQTIVITLTGAAIDAEAAAVKDNYTLVGAPEGIDFTVTYDSATKKATLTVSGTPAVACDAAISVTVGKAVFGADADVATATNANAKWAITRAAINVDAVVTEKPNVSVNESITGDAAAAATVVAAAIEASGEELDLSVDDPATTPVDDATQDDINAAKPDSSELDAIKATITEKNITALTSVDANALKTVVQTYMDIAINEVAIDAESGNAVKSITFDITPMYRVVATSQTVIDGGTGITVFDEEAANANTANAVKVAEGEVAIKAGETVTVKIPLGDNALGNAATLYVTHVKDNGTKYYYTGTVSGKILSFDNPHGFSTMIVSDTESEDIVATLTHNGVETGVDTLAGIGSQIANGDTLTLKKALTAETTITLSAAEMTFTIVVDGADEEAYAAQEAFIKFADVNGYNVTTSRTDDTITVTVAPKPDAPAAPTITPASKEFPKGTATAEVTITVVDGTVVYYTTDNSAPTESNGTRLDATGTFTVDLPATVKAIAVKDGEASAVATATYTVKSGGKKPGGSSGGGGGATSSTTVTIASDDSSVKADVKISGGTATIGKVENISKVVDDGVVSIDLSGQKKDIDTVKVDSSIVNAIANSDDNEGMEIKLSDGTVTFDADAMVSLKGGDLTVKLDKTNANSLNSKQKDAVKDMDVQGYYELTLNKALKDGEVEVRIPFTVPKDKDASDMVLVRVSESGVAEEVSARFSGNEVRFTATESGDYVIVAKAAQTTEPSEPATPTQPAANFSDVDAGAWYGNAVNYVVANGLMSGVGNGLFAPNTNLSRAMLAQILYNQAGRPAAGDAAFNDVASGMWYTNAIAWAAAQGVVSGYGNGMFGPNDNITREQLAVMLYRFAGSPAVEGSLSSFTDAGKVSGYAQNALIWATTNGVMSGKGGGNLDPAGLATRAEVAQMLYNYLNR